MSSTEHNINHKIKKFVSEFAKQTWESFRDKNLEGIGITGSFSKNKLSAGRPDINFALFVKKTSPLFFLKLGKISSALAYHYKSFFNLRPEFHPERFSFPFYRDPQKADVFFKIAIFEKSKKKEKFPFGRPPHVLEGHKYSFKSLYGVNYLSGLKIKTTNEEVLVAVNYVLKKWSSQLNLAPLSYNLEKDVDLFFNEALVWGKLGLMQGVWLEGIKKGFDYSLSAHRKRVLGLVFDKEKIPTFITVPSNVRKKAEFILDCRRNYNEWKKNKRLAFKLYHASHGILEYFRKEAEKQLRKHR